MFSGSSWEVSPQALEVLPLPLFVLRGESGVPNARWRLEFGPETRWSQILHPDSQPGWNRFAEKSRGLIGQFESGVENVRFAASIAGAGGWVECALSAAPGWDEAGEFWLIGATDIEAILAPYEQDGVALRMAERKWRSFFAATATGKAMIGLDGEILVVNPAMCGIFGYSEHEMLQKKPADLRGSGTGPQIDGIYQLLLQNEAPISNVQADYRRADGSEIHLLLSFSLVRDSTGHPLYFAVEMQDETARYQAETALAQKMGEVERSNIELERFAFVASHDLQEPLRKIRVFAGRLEHELNEKALSERGLDYLSRLSNAATRMQQLISDLLEFSRPRRAAPFETVDLEALVRDAASDFEVVLEKGGGALEIGALPRIEGDAARLRQLFCNLIGNALKFRAEAPPQVRISAQRVENAGRPGWEISVSDNGIGFDEADLPRVLEVFGRLHPRDRYAGTGIGLSICRKVAQEHGGDISAQSQSGEGATFLVFLPDIAAP
ncbi:PAS domain S-box-containing protein [Abditibacterium utsteinense]|uniref:histidine kinase n=1 Tax=Abditibacterium utsteinense TaxID=1960156 RepID=A0A2S8SQJ5_9BACT|nr:ATP-binding protein [Abditibacterium utsteinense]PQV63058.1 PAS domain S-box-containing protein [Abditibacterium utsteinense]